MRVFIECKSCPDAFRFLSTDEAPDGWLEDHLAAFPDHEFRMRKAQAPEEPVMPRRIGRTQKRLDDITTVIDRHRIRMNAHEDRIAAVERRKASEVRLDNQKEWIEHLGKLVDLLLPAALTRGDITANQVRKAKGWPT